jgi:uncharacterized Zn finger protein
MIYRYKCQCGYEHSQYLKADRDTIVLKCENCGRGITAHQVRDKSTIEAENNEVVGILRHEKD